MERLCDEILQLIFYELPDPSPLTLVSRRFYQFSEDPYVRAHYFLMHFGPTEAMYHALGRGKVLTEQVLDILLSSGAHLSRYLVQIAMHHYFQTQAHFIRTSWVRNVPFGVFLHFMQKAQAMYGDIPRGKGEDDGSVFMTFLKENRFPSHLKSVTWENILEILEKYKFMPFSNKDPIMAQFPLILAIEPRLLPAAVANGFQMDYKYRDFVFRKMLERHAGDTQADDIAHNIRELCKLDPTMFVTRTVAAEVCMEAKYNDVGYNALKKLNKSGHLHFELGTLVEDLLKTFLTTRAISHVTTGDILRQLYADFPSTDPAVRLVVIISVFISAETSQATAQDTHNILEALGVTPITRKDAYNVLINPFVEKPNAVLEYARQEIGIKSEDGVKGMDICGVQGLVEDVAAKCLEISCKGKLLRKLFDSFPSTQNVVMRLVLERYQIRVEDVPAWEEGEVAAGYVAKLSRDFVRYGAGNVHSEESLRQESEDDDDRVEGDSIEDESGKGQDESSGKSNISKQGSPLMFNLTEHEATAPLDLGDITQESLTTMIRHDELTPSRSRRRLFYPFAYIDTGKASFPHDAFPIAKWAFSHFGVRSSITAVFLTHAVINDNGQLLGLYLMNMEHLSPYTVETQVPITLKHFQIMARLGRAPSYYLYHCIESGAEFYFDEDDYISKNDPAKRLISKIAIKSESPNPGIPTSPISSSRPSSARGRKRPRRTATTNVRSYAVPDSDDDAIMSSDNIEIGERVEKKAVKETNLQLWIRHLGELLKSEQKKNKEYKKRLERSTEPDVRTRYVKTSFLKSLTTNLRALRKMEVETRVKFFGPEEAMDDFSDDDDEYTTRPAKRRRALPTSSSLF